MFKNLFFREPDHVVKTLSNLQNRDSRLEFKLDYLAAWSQGLYQMKQHI